MKLVLTRDLKGDEILGKSIFSSEGKMLLNKGTQITKKYIKNLERLGVYLIYVEDNMLDDVKEDVILNGLKEAALENIVNLFNMLTTCHEENIKEYFKTVDNLINYIIDKKDVSINLYEIKDYDNYTYIHCIDTCIMSVYLGILLGFKKEELRELGIAAVLHDIGKILISNNIINKRGSLTKREFELVKKHSLFSKNILENTKMFSKNIIDAVVQHHERYDGKGYPYGLRGEEINKYAKIISVSDVFTALSSNRSYRKRFSPGEAYEYILSCANTYFDKTVVDKFKESFSVYPLGCSVRLSNGEKGYVVRQNKSLPDKPVIRILNNYSNKIFEPYEIDLSKEISICINDAII